LGVELGCTYIAVMSSRGVLIAVDVETTGTFEDIMSWTALPYKYMKQRGPLIASWQTCEGSTIFFARPRHHCKPVALAFPAAGHVFPESLLSNHSFKQNPKSSALLHNQSVHS
jgi:hypothetical protein